MNKVTCNVNLRCNTCGAVSFKIERNDKDDCIYAKCLTPNCNFRMKLSTAIVIIETKFAMGMSALNTHVGTS